MKRQGILGLDRRGGMSKILTVPQAHPDRGRDRHCGCSIFVGW